MDKIKAQFHKYFDDSLFDNNEAEINKWNRNIVRAGLIASLSIFGGLFIFGLFDNIYSQARLIYGSIIIFSIVVLYLSFEVPDHHVQALVFITHIGVVILCLCLTCIMWPDDVNIGYLSELFIISALVLDKNKRNVIVVTATTVIYIVVISFFKPPVAFLDETINVIAFSILGIVSGTFTKTGLIQNIENNKQLRIAQERYEIAMKQSGHYICEYDIASKCVTLSADSAAIYDIPSKVFDVPRSAIYQGHVSPETTHAYQKMFDEILAGQKSGSALFQAKTVENGWRWHQAQYTTIFSDDHKPILAIISIEDVTVQVEKEKVQRRKAERDDLTGLYSRSTAIRKLNRELTVKRPYSYALMIVDLDGLKEINDSMGHPEGDNAIVTIAKLLQKHFNPGVIGRLGGDEFIVYLDNLESHHDLKIKLDIFFKELNTYKIGNDDNYPITVSIGITYQNSRSYDFNELYEMSDKALYNAKKSGRNRYIFFDENH